MTTISERLRRTHADYDGKLPATANVLKEAADTIDALVDALERLLDWAGPIAGDNIDAESRRTEEESVEQARAALSKAKGYRNEKEGE